MKRRALSGRLIKEKVVFFILLVTVLLFCIKHIPELLFVAAPVFIFLDYMLYYRPNHIEFDSDNLYINRKKSEEIVALRNVYQVKSTTWGIGYKTIWRIKYYARNGIESAWFYPRRLYPDLDDFIKQLKLKNPGAEIKGFK